MLRFTLLGAGSPADRVEALTRVVLDLMMEVEALRAAVRDLSGRAAPVDDGDAAAVGRHGRFAGPSTAYALAYAETAYLTHDAAGPSSGWMKLIDLFYGRDWREFQMLRRLGFTDEQIAGYATAATAAEDHT